jgi:predicted esterase
VLTNPLNGIINTQDNITKQKMTKILLLHGYMQNGSKIMKHFSRLLTSTFLKQHNVQLLSGDGPFVVDEEKQQYGWWHIPSLETFDQPHKYENVQLAIDRVYELMGGSDVVPDIIVGFSQGADLIAILLDRCYPNCKKVYLLSGAPIVDERYIPRTKIQTPSIHFVGEKDDLVTSKHSQLFAEMFEQVEWYSHRWGHVLPKSYELREMIWNDVITLSTK